jgi:hypothetical protein
MARRVVPVVLVIAAAAADGAGAHRLAFYALLLAVAPAAITALEVFGRVLDGASDHLHALLWTLVLGLLVTGTAVRAPLVTEGAVPTLGRSSLLACLVVFCVQAGVAVATEVRAR